MKKITAFFTAALIIISSLILPAFAAGGITLTDANYPTEIIEGNTFSVYGEVKSDTALTSVTCSVINSGGTVAFSRKAYPNSSTFDVHSIDIYMTFSKLTAGEYTYKIVASDKNNSNVVLLQKKFTVKKAQGPTLSNANYPTVIYKGEKFPVYGTVTSDRNIMTVTISVTTSAGKECFSYTGKPGTKTYNINNVSYLLGFSSLDVGEYIYKITVSDTATKNVVLLQKNFTVKIRHTAESDLDKVNWNVIDLSVWNVINSWSDVAAETDAAILRIGYRGTVNRAIREDTKFLDHYKNATAQGLPVGCYFFSNALTAEEASEEADFIINRLKANNCKLAMPVYIDMETDAQINLSRSECTEIAETFCKRIAEAGYYPGIYCSTSFAKYELYAEELAEYTFWLAEYNASCNYTGSYGMWQYSNKGTVSGIDGDVDLNYCYCDYPSYIKENNLNGFEPTVKPDFSFKGGAQISKGILYGVLPKLSANEFISKYITLTGGAKAEISGLKNNTVTTGSTVTVKLGDESQKFTVAALYDVDANGEIDSLDALVVLSIATEKITPTEMQKYSSDVNSDGNIDSFDALMILKSSVE